MPWVSAEWHNYGLYERQIGHLEKRHNIQLLYPIYLVSPQILGSYDRHQKSGVCRHMTPDQQKNHVTEYYSDLQGVNNYSGQDE